jgi:hypothetical protein
MPNKRPYNEKGEPHGYWEKFFPQDKIWFKTNYINGEKYGMDEWYNVIGELKQRTYYAK